MGCVLFLFQILRFGHFSCVLLQQKASIQKKQQQQQQQQKEIIILKDYKKNEKQKKKWSLLHLKKEMLEKLKYKNLIRYFVSFKKNKF